MKVTHLYLLYVGNKIYFKDTAIKQKLGLHFNDRVVQQFAKKGNPFTGDENVNSCILTAVEEFCSDKIKVLHDIGLRTSAAT
jgi:hypothetical protein